MPYDLHAATGHVTRLRALINVSGIPFGFDDAWRSLPAEMLPGEIIVRGRPLQTRAGRGHAERARRALDGDARRPVARQRRRRVCNAVEKRGRTIAPSMDGLSFGIGPRQIFTLRMRPGRFTINE